MRAVKDLIANIRAAVHDKELIEYTDTQLLQYINDAIAYIRMIILDSNAAVLADTFATGTTIAGEITLDVDIARVITLSVNGNIIKPIDIAYAPQGSGEPITYCIVGFNTIKLFPKPQDGSAYHLVAISDMQALKLEGKSPLPNDLDNLIVQYATIKSSLINEFDMSQEMQIFSAITQQVLLYVKNIQPCQVQVSGYWRNRDGVGY